VITKDIEKRVRVIADSVGQVPADLARDLDIPVIPYAVMIQGVSYLDGVDLQPDTLYQRMRVEKVIPKTSAPSPGLYIKALLDCINKGAKFILLVCVSSNLSGAYNIACKAVDLVREEHPDIDIEVFDSKTAAIAEGYVAIQAARAAKAGMDLAGLLQVARETQKRVGIVVSFDTLEYLAIGGRIGKAAYLLGNLIDIKPIISLDSEGFVEPIGKVRGNPKAFEAIIEHVEKITANCRRLQLAVMDADAPDRADELKRLAIERLKPNEIMNTTITPVMGAHTGPGLVGLGYYYE